MHAIRATLLALALGTNAHAQHVNHALAGTASQSATSYDGAASRAIDGNFDGLWGNGSVTHTPDQANSWWEVQLVSARPVHEVRLYNRADCCWARLSNFRVSVHLGATEVWGSDHFVGTGSVPAGQSHTIFPPSNTVGDRVRVELLGLNNDGTGVLSLAEVEVVEHGVLPQSELAQLGIATQF